MFELFCLVFLADFFWEFSKRLKIYSKKSTHTVSSAAMAVIFSSFKINGKKRQSPSFLFSSVVFTLSLISRRVKNERMCAILYCLHSVAERWDGAIIRSQSLWFNALVYLLKEFSLCQKFTCCHENRFGKKKTWCVYALCKEVGILSRLGRGKVYFSFEFFFLMHVLQVAEFIWVQLWIKLLLYYRVS